MEDLVFKTVNRLLEKKINKLEILEFVDSWREEYYSDLEESYDSGKIDIDEYMDFSSSFSKDHERAMELIKNWK